jgi:hypothetical protein
MHVEGRLTWRGKRGGKSGSTLEIMNRNQMDVMEYDTTNPDAPLSAAAAALPPFTVSLTGGLTSTPHSLLLLHSSSRLASSCPRNMTSPYGCTVGRVKGEGEMELVLGKHAMNAPVNVSTITLRNGRNEFFAQAQARKMEIFEGEMILHGYAFAKEVRSHAETRASTGSIHDR